MLSDSGASRHFIDDKLMAGVKGRIKDYVALKPPMIITTAGGHKLEGGSSRYSNSKGILRNVSLLVTLMPDIISICFHVAPRPKRA